MKRILLVDDEPQLLEILREHFEGRYEIDTALSGASAIERFVRQRPDVVFLDVNMPGGSGLAVLKLLRQTDPKIPVVVVTATTENKIAAECIAEGAFGPLDAIDAASEPRTPADTAIVLRWLVQARQRIEVARLPTRLPDAEP